MEEYKPLNDGFDDFFAPKPVREQEPAKPLNDGFDDFFTPKKSSLQKRDAELGGLQSLLNMTRDPGERQRITREMVPLLSQPLSPAEGAEKVEQYRQSAIRKGTNNADYVAERLPVVGLIKTGLEAKTRMAAAKRIEEGKAVEADYEIIGKMLAEPDVMKGRTEGLSTAERVGVKVGDTASALPGVIVEWLMSGPTGMVGKAAARKAAEKALGDLAERSAARLATRAAGVAGEAVGRTVAPIGLAQIGSQALGRTSRGESTGEAIKNAALSRLIDNAANVATGRPGTIPGILGAEISAEGQYRAGVAPRGSTITRMVNGDREALEDFAAMALAFGGMHGIQKATETAVAKMAEQRRKGLDPNHPKNQADVVKAVEAVIPKDATDIDIEERKAIQSEGQGPVDDSFDPDSMFSVRMGTMRQMLGDNHFGYMRALLKSGGHLEDAARTMGVTKQAVDKAINQIAAKLEIDREALMSKFEVAAREGAQVGRERDRGVVQPGEIRNADAPLDEAVGSKGQRLTDALQQQKVMADLTTRWMKAKTAEDRAAIVQTIADAEARWQKLKQQEQANAGRPGRTADPGTEGQRNQDSGGSDRPGQTPAGDGRTRGPVGPGLFDDVADLAFQGRTGKRAINAPAGVPEGFVGPFNIMSTIDTLFGKGHTKTLPNQAAQGLYQQYIDYLRMSGRNAGDVPVRMHEEAHRTALKAPGDPWAPARLTPAERRGYAEFDYQPNRQNQNVAMLEGLSEYVRRYVDGDLANLTPNQQAAAAHAERNLRQLGFMDKADRVKALLDRYKAGSVSDQMAGQISSTGQPAPPVGLTAGEIAGKVAKEWKDAATDHYIDRLAAAARMEEAAARKKGYSPPRPGEDLRSVIAGVHHMADPWADKMALEGTFEFRRQPNGDLVQVRVGEPVGWYAEGFNDAEKKPGGWLDQFILSRHIVEEAEAGGRMAQSVDPISQAKGVKKLRTVSKEQLNKAEAFIEEARKDPAKYAKAEEAASRYTDLHNRLTDLLKSVGFYTDAEVRRMRAEFPTYVPLNRVMGDEAAKGTVRRTREGSGRQIVSPSVTLRTQYDIASTLAGKQLIDARLWEAGEVPGGTRGVPGYWVEVEADKTPLSATKEQDVRDALEAIGYTTPMIDSIINNMGADALKYTGKAEKWDDNKPNYYSMRIDGKPVKIEVLDKLFYEMLTGTQSPKLKAAISENWIGRSLTRLANIQKAGATSASMTFPVRNMFRDPWLAYTNAVKNGKSPGRALLDFAAAIPEVAWQKARHVAGKETTDPVFKMYEENVGEKVRAYGDLVSRGPGQKAWREAQGRATGVREKAIAVANKGKDVLEFMGFGEHVGRFAEYKHALEDMGYDRKTIEASLQTDPNRSPIPFHVQMEALRRAREATTDFGMLGSRVVEWNRITPFFGAHMTGMWQEGKNWTKALADIRNGKLNTPVVKGVASAVTAYLALEAVHAFTFEDEQWYKDLPAHQRHAWWILGRTEGGGVWGIPKPHGWLRMLGALASEGLRGSEGRADLAAKTIAGEAIPQPLPSGLNEAFDVASNRDWSDKPIVPKEGRDLTTFQKWNDHRLPYLLGQATGGLLSPSGLRTPEQAFTAGRTPPNQPLEDLYALYHDTRVERQQSPERRAGRTYANEKLYKVLSDATEKINKLNVELSGKKYQGSRVVDGTPPTPERKRQIQELKLEIARKALKASEAKK